jgi:hypothetical protein
MFKLTDLPKLFDEVMLAQDVKKATKYVSENCTIKVTRIGKLKKNWTTQEFKVTMGTPNYLERLFISDCIKAGEKFPVKKIQLKFYPVKK